MNVRMILAIGLSAGFGLAGLVSAETAATNAPAPAVPRDLFQNPVASVVAPPPAPTSVVAVVNGVEIRQAQVNEIVDRVLRANEGRMPPERTSQIRAQINERATDDLVTQTLLLEAADKAGVKATAEDIEKAKKEMPLPDGKTLEQALAEQKMTVEQLDREMNRALRIQKLLESKATAAAVTDEDIKKFYEENKAKFEQKETVTARHILIKVDEGADEKARADLKKKAEGIRKELENGADFAEMAKKHSEDPGSKDKGGEYTFPRGMMVPEFETAAFTQELNKIGPLVETKFGYHIIQAIRRNPATTVPLAEATPRIKEFLGNKGRGDAVQKFIKDLRDQAKIEYPGRT